MEFFEEAFQQEKEISERMNSWPSVISLGNPRLIFISIQPAPARAKKPAEREMIGGEKHESRKKQRRPT